MRDDFNIITDDDLHASLARVRSFGSPISSVSRRSDTEASSSPALLTTNPPSGEPGSAEELNECGSAVSRCIIQGIDEAEPITGKVNRRWLEDEIADVYANFVLVIDHFNLNTAHIRQRMARKQEHLKGWHSMLDEAKR